MGNFKNAIKIVRANVFTNFKKTFISTIFPLVDKNIKKIENFQFFAEKSIFSSDVHKKNSSKIAIKKVDFLPFLTNFFEFLIFLSKSRRILDMMVFL